MKLAQLEKEKNELNDRIRITAKRIDHLERAFRREELKHIPEDYERQKEHDMELYELQKEETLKEAQLKHKADVALKHRLSRLVPVFTEFRDGLNEKRHEEFEKRRKAAERDLEAKKKQRVKEVVERRRREKAEREEEERRRQEEEERVQREEEERVAREEEQRRAMAERKAQREEERKYVTCVLSTENHHLLIKLNYRKLDEIAAKQKQREEEAEARRAARKAGVPAAPEPTRAEPTRAEPTAERGERSAPRLNLAPRTGGAGASWRERQAAKEAAGETAAPAPAPAAAEAAPAPAKEEPAALPRKTGGYVPPAMRQGGAPAPRSAAPPPAGEKYVPRHMREGGAPAPRPAAAPPAASASERTEESKPSGGKWVPSWKKRDQQ
jgi:translation initiation factor 3 subunit A